MPHTDLSHLDTQQWVKSLQQEWREIYEKFLIDTQEIITRGGGPNRVQIHTCEGDHSHKGLLLGLDFWGRFDGHEGTSGKVPIPSL
jgi:hypothetical protein